MGCNKCRRGSGTATRRGIDKGGTLIPVSEGARWEVRAVSQELSFWHKDEAICCIQQGSECMRQVMQFRRSAS